MNMMIFIFSLSAKWTVKWPVIFQLHSFTIYIEYNVYTHYLNDITTISILNRKQIEIQLVKILIKYSLKLIISSYYSNPLQTIIPIAESLLTIQRNFFCIIYQTFPSKKVNISRILIYVCNIFQICLPSLYDTSIHPILRSRLIQLTKI